MRDDEDHLLDGALHHGPRRDVVVAVGMMRQDRQGQAHREKTRNADGLETHHRLLGVRPFTRFTVSSSRRWSNHGSIDRRREIPDCVWRLWRRKFPLAVAFGVHGAIANGESLLIGPPPRLPDEGRGR